MELVEVCLRTTYFQVGDMFSQQKEGMAVGSSLSLIVSNIYKECFGKLALDSVQHKLLLWLCYVGDTFVVWPHGPEWLQNFLSYLNSLRPSIQFTVKIVSDSVISFLDSLVIRKEITMVTKVYRKPNPCWPISQL
jgi:hypothetical protein